MVRWLLHVYSHVELSFCVSSLATSISLCQYSTVGVLVMVSSELVVLLIVCAGINTGSTQQQQGETTM